VRVRVEASSAGAMLGVSDEGPGIPPAERARVLGRFYRALGTSEPGVGLGLSIVARIAALHGAALDLADGPEGRGLSVRVSFPAQVPAASRAPLGSG
jgi:signal transduction histidine kinase